VLEVAPAGQYANNLHLVPGIITRQHITTKLLLEVGIFLTKRQRENTTLKTIILTFISLLNHFERSNRANRLCSRKSTTLFAFTLCSPSSELYLGDTSPLGRRDYGTFRIPHLMPKRTIRRRDEGGWSGVGAAAV